jgi:hypothetical protein
MAVRRARLFEIRVLGGAGRQGQRETALSPASAARVAAKFARQGREAEVIDVDRSWTAMVCRPERRGRRVVARCEIKEPFKRRIKFTGRPRG